jgi:hypothetical protein
MKRLIFPALLTLVLAIPATAQSRWGVRAGLMDSEAMVGAEYLVPIGAGFVFNPNVEVSSDLRSAMADVHYDIDIDNRSAWWIGAGVGFVHPDEGDLGFGVNLHGGYGRSWNNLYPYAQVKFTSPGDDIGDFTTVAVGVRF